MNRIHEDGRALLKLARQAEHMTGKDSSRVAAESPRAKKSKIQPKPAPATHVQRQDTDYDVKPSIKKPKPAGRGTSERQKHAEAAQHFSAAPPDTGVSAHETQMGESEGQVNHDASKNRARALRAFCD
jgi:hypothetical protein